MATPRQILKTRADASPIGESHASASRSRSARSEAYRAARAEYAAIRALRKRHPIAAHLRERRLELGMTQDAVAHAAGTSYSAISRLEKGTYLPRLVTLRKIATVLDEETEICFSRSVDGEVEHEHTPIV